MWETLPSMNAARVAAAAVAVSGQIYAMGGRDGFQSLASTERYDPRTQTWQVLPPLQSARFGGEEEEMCRWQDLLVFEWRPRLDLRQKPRTQVSVWVGHAVHDAKKNGFIRSSWYPCLQVQQM
jgi:hypothetical protein